jgi:hypothetical protein
LNEIGKEERKGHPEMLHEEMGSFMGNSFTMGYLISNSEFSGLKQK